MAAAGIRFTDAHAPDAVCSPTRYGVLTGRYCFRSRLKAGVLPPWGAPIIERTRLTVPELLRRHGYATACTGKWHLGWTWPTRDGKLPQSRDGLGNVDFTLRQERGYAPNAAAGELYNLRDDLPQRANLYAQKPEIVWFLSGCYREALLGGVMARKARYLR
jgi:arylsulfatase A-like enzyme